MRSKKQVVEELKKRLKIKPSTYSAKAHNDAYCRALLWVLNVNGHLTIDQIVGLINLQESIK